MTTQGLGASCRDVLWSLRHPSIRSCIRWSVQKGKSYPFYWKISRRTCRNNLWNFPLTRSQFLAFWGDDNFSGSPVAWKRVKQIDQLQYFVPGCIPTRTQACFHLASYSPGFWSLCRGCLCHCTFCKNCRAVTLRQEVVELSQHPVVGFVSLPLTLLQSLDLQLHCFGFMDLQKDTESGPFRQI